MSQRLYFFVGTVNGDPVGSQRDSTLDDVRQLMACDTHGAELDEECWSCRDTARFLEELEENLGAVAAHYDGDNIYISSAVYQGLSE